MRTPANGGQLRQTGKDVIAGKVPGFLFPLIIGITLAREGSEIVLFHFTDDTLPAQTAASM